MLTDTNQNARGLIEQSLQRPATESATLQGLALTAAPIVFRAITTKRVSPSDLLMLGSLGYAAWGRLRKGDLRLSPR